MTELGAIKYSIIVDNQWRIQDFVKGGCVILGGGADNKLEL